MSTEALNLTESVGVQVDGQVDEQVRAQVRAQVDDQVYGQVGDQVGAQVEDLEPLIVEQVRADLKALGY